VTDLVFYGVGDVAPHRADPDDMFKYVAPLFRQGDIVFGNLEESLSDRGAQSVHASLPMKSEPRVAKAIKDAGFHAVSFANNHCMDWGRDALVDTVEHVRAQGLAITGSGDSIAEARVPAVVERDGVRMAFVAASSILPLGYWAEARRAGCVPMRAYTHYEQIEHDQPGTPARIHTFPHPEDLQNLLADIRAAKAAADIVVLSIHWGVHFIPEVIADYQRAVAHAAIDAGCDLILGHHPHILKGVEVYKGRAIFHSLGNFAIEFPSAWSNIKFEDRPRFKEIRKLNPGIDKSRFPDDMMKTGIVKCVIADRAIKRVSFLPCDITETSEPRPLKAGETRFNAVADYLETITRSEAFDTVFVREGDEVVIAL
jgi:poly-gamma-glutamate capsule biosynthesis protein CapA/YwtB (metallophosphatase superfamily)